MDDLLGIISMLILGPWFWLGVALGLAGAWLAWTYLPPTMDRTSVAAWIFVIRGWLHSWGRDGDRWRKEEMNRSNQPIHSDATSAALSRAQMIGAR